MRLIRKRSHRGALVDRAGSFRRSVTPVLLSSGDFDPNDDHHTGFEEAIDAISIADFGMPDGLLDIRNALRTERAARNRYMRAQRRLMEYLWGGKPR